MSSPDLASGIGALRAPLYDLASNWAYMVIAALAWNLKSWFVMMTRYKADRRACIRIQFRRFFGSVILIPAMIVRRGRGVTVRLIGHTPASTGSSTPGTPSRDSASVDPNTAAPPNPPPPTRGGGPARPGLRNGPGLRGVSLAQPVAGRPSHLKNHLKRTVDDVRPTPPTPWITPNRPGNPSRPP